MKARDRKQFTEAWNLHVSQLRKLVDNFGAADERVWVDMEKTMREWVTVAADMSFPEPEGNAELPGDETP